MEKPASPKTLCQKRKVLNFIGSKEFKKWKLIISRKFQEDSRSYGESWHHSKLIILNPYKGKGLYDAVKTIIHEVLHVVAFPVSDSKKIEKQVRRAEREVYKACSPNELTYIIREFFRKAIWDD